MSKVLLYWQYALTMQLVEGVAWIQYNDNVDLTVVSAFALFFNVTQPIVLALIIRFGMQVPVRHAFIANLMYTALLLTDRVWAFSDIAPAPECNHLELRYWDVPRTTLYMLATLISFLEIPDRVWALVNISIFLGSLFLAMIITSCGVGLLFCWLIFMSWGCLGCGALRQTNRREFSKWSHTRDAARVSGCKRCCRPSWCRARLADRLIIVDASHVSPFSENPIPS